MARLWQTDRTKLHVLSGTCVASLLFGAFDPADSDVRVVVESTGRAGAIGLRRL